MPTVRPFLRSHRAATALVATAAVLAGVVVVVALRSDGYESRHVDLNDGGVWVTSDTEGLFGRLNKPAGSLDLALNPPGGAQSSYQLDVRQSGAAVTAWDQGSGKLLPVDVSAGKAQDDQAIPVSADENVGLAGDTLAVLDPAVGKVWATQVDTTQSISSLAAVDPSAKAAITFPKRDVPGERSAALAVGGDGTVYAADSAGDVAVAAPDGDRFAKPTFTRMAGRMESVQVTAVGSTVVVLDARQGELHLPGGRTVRLPRDPDAVLQEPSDAGRAVVVASRTKLYSVPLSGGDPTTLYSGTSGRPARPTWLGDCVHAAWAGEPGVYARACGGTGARQFALPNRKALERPVFRVNRGQILLNDLSLGNVYDVDTMQQVDNWSAVKPPPLLKPSKKDKNNKNSVASRDQPPKAVDDTWGARPGRTTVVHVLDNDSDPQGRILSIARLGSVNDPHARVGVAPDGQSVEVTLPDTGARDLQFKYTIDNGQGRSAQADVDIQVRTEAQNAAPRKRYGFTQRSFTAAAGGSLDLPVLDDWRDFDGDPLVLTKATADKGTVTVAPSGRVNYLAPGQTGSSGSTSAAITYEVADGRSDAAKQVVPLTVLGPTSDQTAAPVAEPDIVRGQVGKPITVKPLANDLPGADPTNPDAELGIAGTIASPAGSRVDTDLDSGTVTVTATRAGTFALRYTASYGNAKFDRAPIRVDVAPAPASAQPPTAVPDTGVLYGQTAATIDVLANDYDPAGGVLVVQRAEPSDPDQVQVAVVGGRFLRVGARVPELRSNPAVIEYTITNGLTTPVRGELTVTQVPPPDNDTPLAVDDYATVRSGDSALVPVLDNDIDPAGASLDLLDDVPDAPSSGALTVASSEGRKGELGGAYVSQRQVRYAAPVVTRPTAVAVTYVAHNASGGRGTGTLHVTVTPPPSKANPNQAPAAQPVNARAVSGQTVRIKIPTTGVDPDGDTANLLGIASAPTLGRIVSIGATTITYEAFPTTSGTDRFDYLIGDRFGKTSRSSVSIGVAQVAEPQPPVAVDDTVTAAPGADVRVDVLANDVVAPDDSVTVGDLDRLNTDRPTKIKNLGVGGPVRITARPGDGESVDVLYSISDGSGDPSVATVTVRSQRGYVPPPTVDDVSATPKPDATSATVDVLSKATDPQALRLRVAKVYDARAVVRGGKVTVPVTSQVQNIVYTVANTQGGTAAAVIHVPARGTGLPYVKADQLITIGTDKARTIDLADYVVDPAGRAVRLTTTDRLSTAPAEGLKLTSPDPTHLTVQGTGGYNGPGAITFEVTDGKTLNDPDGQTALLTLQVQVGPDTPVVRCPSAPLSVVEGGPDRRLNITSLCHVWLGDRAQLSKLRYTATWTNQPKDVAILGDRAQVIGLRAGGSAVPGQTGTLRIGVDGTDAKPSTLNVTVRKLGPPSMNPIRVDGVKAGTTVTRDIRGSVQSPLRDPNVRVQRVERVTGMPATATASGSRVSITPGRNSHGVITFNVIGTDVPDGTRSDRRFRGRITLEVLNVPNAPGAPQAGRTVLSETVVLSWPTPAANGAPIDRYEVGWPGGSQTCPASPCRITGLTNGRPYSFTVRAHNAVGFSKPSPRLTPPAKPDKLPAAVAAVRTSDPQDGRITVSWQPVDNGSSRIKNYRVSWSGGGSAQAAGTARAVVARGLDNHNVYTFTVVAVNDLGAGPPASTRGQSAGTPATPAGVTAQYADAAGTDARAIRVTWTPSDANGPTPPTYTVTRNGTTICRGTTQPACNDTAQTGQTYTYSVVATNGAGKRSAPGASAPFVVAGTPGTPAGVASTYTDNNGELRVTYTAPDPNGQQPKITCSTNTNGPCGEWTPPAAGTGDTRTIGNLAQDTDVVVTLVACNEQQCGQPASAPPAHTSGPPRPATGGSCGLNGQTITWRWSAPAAYNGHPVTRYAVSIDGGGESTVGDTNYSRQMPDDGKNHTASIVSIDNRGQRATSANSVSCKAKDPPDPVTVSWEYSSDRVGGCQFHSGGGCPHAVVIGHNFSGSVSCTVDWQPAGSKPGPRQTRTVTLTSGNGYKTQTNAWYGFTAHIVITCSNGAKTEGDW